MHWFYAKDDQQMGPVDSDELGELLRAGELTPATLVWSQGMED